jgi:hypothetical protein
MAIFILPAGFGSSKVEAKESAKSLLQQIFLSGKGGEESDEEEKHVEMLNVFARDLNGLLYLSLPFIGFDFYSVDYSQEQESGSDAELIAKIRSIDDSVYKNILATCRDGSLDSVTRELINQASKKKVGVLSNDIDDMFSPL